MGKAILPIDLENNKPWEEYPHIWKTEAAFWAYLRGSLRRAVWEKSPIKLDFKNSQMIPPPKGYTGRGKKGQYCALTGEWEMTSKLQVDHVEGEMSLTSWDDVLPFLLHLIPKSFDDMQLVTIEAHKIKSHLERYGEKKGLETFEQAKADKMVIAFCNVHKGVDKLDKAMQNIGIDTADLKNIKERKTALYKHFLEEIE